MYVCMPEEGTRSHYRCLRPTMWLLELRTSGRAASALNLLSHLSRPLSCFLFVHDKKKNNPGGILPGTLLVFPECHPLSPLNLVAFPVKMENLGTI